MSYKLFLDKSEKFKCKVTIEGANPSTSKVRLIVTGTEFSVLFNGTLDENGNCIIPIKPLKKVFTEGESGTLSLEVIAEDAYFLP
jgi:hypothetical protein